MALTKLNNQSIAALTDFNLSTDDLPAGTVLQVVNMPSTQVSRAVTTSSSFTASYITNSITPIRSNSKFVVRVATTGNNNGSNYQLAYSIARKIGSGSFSVLRPGTSGANDWGMGQVWGQSSRIQVPLSTELVDVPNTSETLTYTLYFRSQGGGNVELPATTTEHCEMSITEIAQ